MSLGSSPKSPPPRGDGAVDIAVENFCGTRDTPVMCRLFTVAGEGAEIVDGGRGVRGGFGSLCAWARMGDGFSEGTHAWRLKVRTPS